MQKIDKRDVELEHSYMKIGQLLKEEEKVSSIMTSEDYKDYQEGVRKTSKYLASPIGLSKYQSSSVSDQTTIRQDNTIIQLLIHLHKKIIP